MAAQGGPCSGGSVGRWPWIGSPLYNFKIHTKLTSKRRDSESKCQLNDTLTNTEKPALLLLAGQQSFPGKVSLPLEDGFMHGG